jgi:hypothetical protein
MSLQLAACVSGGGREGGLALETENAQGHENANKRGAYPPSAARLVRQQFLTKISFANLS